jgi:endonuclease YncB( thermonuclease family)
MPRKSCPRLRTVTIKGKEFHQVSVPQPGGGRRLRTFKDGNEAWRFFLAVQGEGEPPGSGKRPLKPRARPMLTRFIAMLVLSVALGVRGQDALTPITYTFGLEHVTIHGRITGIVDGDTINALILGKQQIRVRIAFIDAPEKGQAFGQRAKQAMSELVFGKDVKLRPHTIDRHGRLVARVLIDNQDAGLELLKRGLSWVYEKYVTEAPAEIQTSYRAAQATAQSDRLGLWQDPDPVPPWEWRKEKRATSRFQSVSSLSIGCCSTIAAFCRPPLKVTLPPANLPKNQRIGLRTDPEPVLPWEAASKMTDVLSPHSDKAGIDILRGVRGFFQRRSKHRITV